MIDKAHLFEKRDQPTQLVRLESHGDDVLIQALTPGEVAEIYKLCMRTAPDPERPDRDRVTWDGTMLGCLFIARALREPDGTRMFPADGQGLLIAAELCANALTNPDVELLVAEVRALSRIGEDGRPEWERDE